MAIKTTSAADAAAKWQRRAAGATEDYVSGVQNPSVPWDQATKAAAGNYKTAVIAAANAGKFERGVTEAGNATYQKGVEDKGSARWAPGIAASGDQFQRGISEVLSTVASLTLPPRGVKGDPRNLERVRIVADALHKKSLT